MEWFPFSLAIDLSQLQQQKRERHEKNAPYHLLPGGVCLV